MKRRIINLVMVIVTFVVLLLTVSYILLSNYQLIKSTKDSLKNVNNLIFQYGDFDSREIAIMNEIRINDSKVRFTLIDMDGNVLYDNEGNTAENHRDRLEVKGAIENGESYTSRYSDTMRVNYMYYATKINNNMIIRSSVPISSIEILTNEKMKYYVLLIIVVITFSLCLSLRLIKKFIEPVKELERVTFKMANGDYKIRVNIQSDDELGVLGKSFNNMADQLQIKIQEVIEKQFKLESILKSMDSGVIAVDNDNRVISINPCAELILGIKKSIIGEYITDYINDYDINEFINNDGENDKEIIILHPIERNLRVKKSDIIGGINKFGKVISFQDITDMKRVELMRTQFVANVSHELKTPLTSIKGFAETLKIVDDYETREKFLDIINKEADRLTRLIDDILVLSKIESNFVCDVEEFLPGKVIKEVLDITKKTNTEKIFEIEFNDENCELILGDRDKFYQLCLNLIENAMKYSKEYGGKIVILSYSENGYYHMNIIDNGIGIPKEDVSRIFERFYRVDKSRKKGGTGLGLAIVKHIVKTFNGEINVKSELGKGSTFEVKIPCL